MTARIAQPGRTRTRTPVRAALGLIALLVTLALAPTASAEPTPDSTPTPPTSSAPSTTTETTETPPPPTESTAPTTTDPPVEVPPTVPPPTEAPPADTTPFSEQINAASAGREELAAEALRLSRLVLDTELRLAQLELAAEAAADSNRQAEAALAEAHASAQRAQQAAAEAVRALRGARRDLADFARDAYINNSEPLAGVLALLDSAGPADLIERAALLEAAGINRSEALDEVLVTQQRSDAADDVASRALETNVLAEAQAQATLDASTALLEQQQATLPALLAQQAEDEASFYAALVELLGPEGADTAFAEYEQQQLDQQAAEAAARAAAYGGGPVLSGTWALPLRGRFTSCFCQRWGIMHWGIDIAAPMFTPLYAAGDGVVTQAGAATGFGQAVYIQHDNGDVTTYGHMSVIEVTVGQRVIAGQEIALVGSEGFSTGPHLHFEVRVGGLTGPRVDPVAWLANRGIFV